MKTSDHRTGIAKCPTGIRGLDEITYGGLPRGRPTLVCGRAGSGKTLLAIEFLIRGARDFGEPGVFVSFEETAEELVDNVASLGFDLPALIDTNRLAIDHVRIVRSEIEQTGDYDLEGLFVRLGAAIDSVGARRVAIDSLEALFAALPSETILRAELRRLFAWLKDRGVTAVITAEQGQAGELTRHGIEEYVSDCVIVLDHRVVDQVATRRLRIVKYRGTRHGTNEYPTMIDETGLSVLPISSVGLAYKVSTARVSTGVPALDGMLGEKGYFRGSSILISGAAGTGKSSFAATFVDSACRRGEGCLYLAYEEAPSQIIRNMSSIGLDLAVWVQQGRLSIHAVRSTLFGLEEHLVSIYKLIEQLRPACVVVDPVTSLASGSQAEIAAMLIRLVDLLKHKGITALFTSLTTASLLATAEVGISSVMDTWLMVRQNESDSACRRSINILKSRGMAHSSARCEFQLSSHGIEIKT